MQDKVVYEFSIIRVVPKVERGEFLNVGVILFSKKQKYIDMKYTLDKKRLSSFSSDIDIEELQAYLQAWKSICHGNSDGGKIGELPIPERFRWLTASKSTILQCSPVHPGLGVNMEQKLKDLFQKYVL
jgi:hypothetical protein